MRSSVNASIAPVIIRVNLKSSGRVCFSSWSSLILWSSCMRGGDNERWLKFARPAAAPSNGRVPGRCDASARAEEEDEEEP